MHKQRNVKRTGRGRPIGNVGIRTEKYYIKCQNMKYEKINFAFFCYVFWLKRKKKLRWCILPTPLVYYNWQVKFPCHVCGKVGCEFLILFTNEIKFFTMQFKLVWINFVENLNYVYKWNAKFMQNYILKKGKN